MKRLSIIFGIVVLILLPSVNVCANNIEYKVELGSSGMFLGFGNDPSPNYNICFNHFDAVSPYNTITDLKVYWGGFGGGNAIAAIWDDPNGDGSSADSSLLMSKMVSIGGEGWSTYDVPDTSIGSSFFAGFAWMNSNVTIALGEPTVLHSYESSCMIGGVDDISGAYNISSLTYYHLVIRADATEAVPEPATILLLGSGLIGLIGFRKKFKK